jgi:nucleoside-diphosphate-sugar epimerase
MLLRQPLFLKHLTMAVPVNRYLTDRQKTAFEKVEFIQGNLTRDASIDKAFAKEGDAFDYVFNCAGMVMAGAFTSHCGSLSFACL